MTISKERNLAQAKILADKIDMDVLFDAKQDKLIKELRPQNIIRFIEKALKSQRAINASERESKDVTPAQHLINEFQEIYFDTLISYYITMHYVNERQYQQASLLAKHAIQLIENCMDFVAKSGSGKQNISILDPKVNEQSEYLKSKLLGDLKKLQVKIHSKYLMNQAEAKAKTEKELQKLDLGQEEKAQVQINNLYDLLFDPYGQSKTKNLNQKVVVRGDTLEILGSHGNAIGIESISTRVAEEPFENLKWNKGLKVVNPIPHFQSVPATAHLFDLAGGTIDYPDVSEEAATFQIKKGLMSAIGGFFGKK